MSVLGFHIDYLVNNREDAQALQRMSLAFERTGRAFTGFGRHFFPALLPLLEDNVREQFEAQGQGPNVGSWAPLTPAYAAWKEREYPGKPILRRTDKLFEALTSSTSPFAEREYGAEDFAFGTAGVPYASYPQEGTARMDDRPPFDFGEPLERDIRRAATDSARELVRDSGLAEFADFEDD